MTDPKLSDQGVGVEQNSWVLGISVFVEQVESKINNIVNIVF